MIVKVKVSDIESIASNKINYRPEDLLTFTQAMCGSDDNQEVVININDSDFPRWDSISKGGV